jgi:hypothetical protein
MLIGPASSTGWETAFFLGVLMTSVPSACETLTGQAFRCIDGKKEAQKHRRHKTGSETRKKVLLQGLEAHAVGSAEAPEA